MQAVSRQIYAEPVWEPLRRPEAARARVRLDVDRIMKALGVLALLAFINVYQQALVAQNNVDISRVRGLLHTEQVASDKLKVEAMVLESPERIERIAVDRLGMTRPQRVTYIVLPKDMAGGSRAGKTGAGMTSRMALLPGGTNPIH